MIGHGEKLSRNREWAIAALLANPPIPEACRAAGIGERTMYRWLADEGFGKAYRAARRKIVQQAITQIQASIATAVQTLEAIMKDEESPASSRVPAAKTIIETGLKSLKNWKPVAGHWKMS
jgi:hypothetical protein